MKCRRLSGCPEATIMKCRCLSGCPKATIMKCRCLSGCPEATSERGRCSDTYENRDHLPSMTYTDRHIQTDTDVHTYDLYMHTYIHYNCVKDCMDCPGMSRVVVSN